MSTTYGIDVHEIYPEEQGEYPILVPTGRKKVAPEPFLRFQIDAWASLQNQFFLPQDLEFIEGEELGYEWYRRVSVFQNTPLHLVRLPSWLGEPNTGWTYPSEFKNLSYEADDLGRKSLYEDDIHVLRLLKLVSKLSDEKFVVFVSRV